MVDDEVFERCRPILEDERLGDEEKTEQLEELLKDEFKGVALENAVLDALWRHRNANSSDTPFRGTIVRKQSPAPWQINRAPTPLASPSLGSSPSLRPVFPASRPSFTRQKSSAPSPFSSPRPSPRLAYAQPIPHSPSLSAYQFSENSTNNDTYGDYGSDTVDWLENEDVASNASSVTTPALSAAAPEWQPQPDMSPRDILRSVLGDKKTNEEIDDAFERSSYDIGQTIAILTGEDTSDSQLTPDYPQRGDGSVLIGKSMATQARPLTPGSSKSPIVCKYWLASGSCLRADCRFAHDTSSHVCKYWLNGSCLAGDSCQFSHDPSLFMSALSMNDTTTTYGTPPQNFQLQEQMEQFPHLQGPGNRGPGHTFSPQPNGQFPIFTPMSQQRGRGNYQYSGSRPQSRPSSRQQHRPEAQSALSMDDPDAFPTLSSLNAKRSSKHHGHRPRHGHGSIERDTPSSLADVVRMTPSPAPAARKVDLSKKIRSSTDHPAASAIPQPQHIPWLETGERANQQYLKARAEAIRHGSIRNKFLQSAAQAWNRNDARAAKALSIRGQAENEAMRKAHREAADALFEERNTHLKIGSSNRADEEMYVDLHGLHPEEAIDYLEKVLLSLSRSNEKICYAITGTGHHSKGGKDKVGKSVRGWLTDCGYVFREFSVPGERGGYIGGVLGIDVTSARPHGPEGGAELPATTAMGGKIQVLKREEIAA